MLTDYVEARKFYDYNEHSRVGAKHGEFVTDEICDRFCAIGSTEQVLAKLRELESIGVDQFNVYLMTEGQEATLEAYGRDILPQVRSGEGVGGGVAESTESLARWDASAAAWEAEADAMAAVNAPVTQALLTALAPGQGDVILELAGGTGELAAVLAPRVAQVIYTDFSPAMVDAARRRGIPGVEHRVLDMQAIDLPDASVDGVICRYGYMLVPDPALALRETRRVLRPGGRVALATWAPARRTIPGRPVRPGLDRARATRAAAAGRARTVRTRRAGADRVARARRRLRRT